MTDRHNTIGIKQTLRIEWLDKAVALVLSGLPVKSIRSELHEYLSNKNGSGSSSTRGQTSRSQVVNMLMKIWVSPDDDLIQFRDAMIKHYQENSTSRVQINWGMLSASYPFWFKTSTEIGRLLTLQDHVTQKQIFSRLKEKYGDRETVSRYARYTIRTFVNFGILKESGNKGTYKKAMKPLFLDDVMSSLLIEATLHSLPEGRSSFLQLQNHPGLFPFSMPLLYSTNLNVNNKRLSIETVAFDQVFLSLKSQI